MVERPADCRLRAAPPAQSPPGNPRPLRCARPLHLPSLLPLTAAPQSSLSGFLHTSVARGIALAAPRAARRCRRRGIANLRCIAGREITSSVSCLGDLRQGWQEEVRGWRSSHKELPNACSHLWSPFRSCITGRSRGRRLAEHAGTRLPLPVAQLPQAMSRKASPTSTELGSAPVSRTSSLLNKMRAVKVTARIARAASSEKDGEAPDGACVRSHVPTECLCKLALFHKRAKLAPCASFLTRAKRARKQPAGPGVDQTTGHGCSGHEPSPRRPVASGRPPGAGSMAEAGELGEAGKKHDSSVSFLEDIKRTTLTVVRPYSKTQHG